MVLFVVIMIVLAAGAGFALGTIHGTVRGRKQERALASQAIEAKRLEWAKERQRLSDTIVRLDKELTWRDV